MQKVKFLVAAAVLLFGGICFAEDVDLDKIVVTPYRYSEEITKTASSITVIDSQEIQDSNAQVVSDVLRPIAGLAVRDFYGNGTKASVDIRGFGELGANNCLVLVDGRRINEIDLSGVDWTQIPLDQVQKIEVVRGGSGGVLYGDNAVSGVVNIITKTGHGKPHLVFETQAGSYAMNKQVLGLSGSLKKFSYLVNASHDNSNGYRKNSYYKGQDFGSKLGYEVSPDINLRFSNSYHASSFGLPGAIRDSQFKFVSRTDTLYPDDHAHESDYYFDFGADKKFDDWGTLDSDVSFRSRQVYSHLGSYNPVYKTNIDTFGFTPKYILPKIILNHDNKVITGVDYYESKYKSDNYNDNEALQNLSKINKVSLGYYMQDELAILRDLILLGGFRYEYAKYSFRYHDNNGWTPDINDQKVKNNKKAFNGGLIYKYSPDSNVFVNYNQNFRFPATDEYFSAFATPPINTNLKPQTAKNLEVGVKHKFSDFLSCDLTLFRMNVKNELIYNPLTYANENYDKTRHQGIEFGANSKVLKNLTLFGSYTFNKSTFIGDPFDNDTLPMVPRHKASLGFKLAVLSNLMLNMQGDYVSSRYFINDQANNLSPANGYFTADLNIAYDYKGFTATFGVNNITNKHYSEYVAYSTAYGEKGYYPSPLRNFYLKLKYQF